MSHLKNKNFGTNGQPLLINHVIYLILVLTMLFFFYNKVHINFEF